MPKELVMCPLCGRRVYLLPPTSGQWRARELAFEANVYPHGPDVDFTPDWRPDDELDLRV
jgi:hypothetical protein